MNHENASSKFDYGTASSKFDHEKASSKFDYDKSNTIGWTRINEMWKPVLYNTFEPVMNRANERGMQEVHRSRVR